MATIRSNIDLQIWLSKNNKVHPCQQMYVNIAEIVNIELPPGQIRDYKS